MAAVAIPLIIHLWNDRQGKTLLIGSIAFLDKSSRRQSRSPRISEWLLLILRCLLLLVLALLLSGPFWRKPPAVAAKGWVLLGDTTLASGSYKILIDSLLRSGYQRHALEVYRDGGTTDRDGLAADHEGGTRDTSTGPSWWAAFLAMDHRAPAGIPFYVFTDGRLVHFRGGRPSTDRVVHWYLASDTAAAADNKITGAWTSGPDSITVLTLGSRPTGSSYSYHTETRGGRQSLSMDSQTVIVDTATLRVRIVADKKYNNDGGYLAAAIRALQKFTRRNIRVEIADSDKGGREDWVFWLSAAPLPASLAADHILVYQPGREIPVDSWVEGMDVAVSRIVEAVKEAGLPVWKDGFGKSLLNLEERDGKKIFHFYSRFDPAWNGLVWSPRFPATMGSLLLEDGSFPGAAFVNAGDDRRVLDPQQVLPRKRRAGGEDSLEAIYEIGKADMGMTELGRTNDAALSPNIDLTPACWLLACILLAAERWVSYRKTKKNADG